MRVNPWRPKPGPLLLVMLTVATIGYSGSRVATGNFHTVVPGTLYRSGQLPGDQWATYLQTYAIKSLLNLRGERWASEWYQAERRAAVQLRVTHYDVTLSASREVDSGTHERILALMRQAPTPLWIH